MAGRPYGIGIYGTGRYGNGPAAVAYELAAQSQIAFQAFAKPAAVYAGTGAATSITLLPQAAFIRIAQPSAATQISFSVQVRPNVIHQVRRADADQLQRVGRTRENLAGPWPVLRAVRGRHLDTDVPAVGCA